MRWLFVSWVMIGEVLAAAEPGCAFWVWHRDTVLTPTEAQQLNAGHCDTLFWHVGNAAVRDGAWAGQGPWLAPAENPAVQGVRCVPVLRGMMAGVKMLPADHAGLLRLIQRAMERWHSDEVQLDFDCPDRLLPAYAAQLAACREAIRPARLSITALAGWAALPVFVALQRSVDELVPMFYDLEPDKPADVAHGKLLPLLDEPGIARHVANWSRCATPWRAGLPCFARLSIFDPDGRSRGHIREWTWDEPTFHSALRSQPAQGIGLAWLEVTKNTSLHGAPLLKGQRLAVKQVDVDEASRCVAKVRAAGSHSACWFRLPTGSASSGWSLAQTMSLAASSPELKLVMGDEQLWLENVSASDLRPLFPIAPDQQRGWQMELEHVEGRPVFRDVTAGDFAHLGAHCEPDAATPREASVAEATRLTFWLGDLKAGAVRRVGVFQLAPNIGPQSLRWRLIGGSDTTAWHSLVTASP